MQALVIIDMLNDFIDEKGALYIGPAAKKVVPAVKNRLLKHRESGNPVIYVCDRHLRDDAEFAMFPPHCLENDWGESIIPALSPLPGERIVYKRRYSAFFGTDLDLTLREKGIKQVELAGVVTNICVLYSAADARMLNYEVSLDPSAVASFDLEAHRFALAEMEKTLGVKIIQ